MTSRHVTTARRNAAVMGASAVTVGLLFLYPTSLGNGHGKPPKPAPAGIVGTPSPGATQPTAIVVNGAAADTSYGPVQVQITVRDKRIVSARAVVYPEGSRRDREINRSAIPLLNQEAVAAQSAQIDTVSGATYTSDGYRRSLQAAIDLAHL